MKIRPGPRRLIIALTLAGLAGIFWLRTGTPATPDRGAIRTGRQVAAQGAPQAPASAAAPRTRPQFVTAVPAAFSTDWKAGAEPVLAAFHDWTTQYLAAAPAERARLTPEGLEWARRRRPILKRLIQTDPRAALAAAVPMVVRQQLPAEIVDVLEARISARGALSLNAVTPLPGQKVAEPVYRSALLDGEEYRAYVYGRRETQATVPATSVVGIAVDRALAVSESPLRVLEAGEIAADRPLDVVCAVSGNVTPAAADTPLNLAGEPTAVEYNGKVQVLCHVAHVRDLEARLLASEVDHIQTAADNQAGSSGVAGRPTSAWTHGTKKVLIIRVDFLFDPAHPEFTGTPVTLSGSNPITPDVAVNLFNNANGVRDFYVAGSYNQTSLLVSPVSAGVSPDVTPVLHLARSAASYAVAGDNDLLHSDARAAALAAGYDEANYDRVGVVFSSLGSIPSSQITYGGLGEVIGKYFWVNGEYDLRVVAHEIGHNYGLMHANLWQVSDGNPISPAGTSIEYGDIFDVMGSGSTYQYEFTHWNKSILQWIPDTSVTLASTAGTYRVYRFDGGTATNLSNARALKIVRDSTRDYWIGYRRGTTNASLDGGAYVLWGYNTNQQGNLLDMTTPGVNPSGTHDEGLALGATFTDSVAGITITPQDQGGSGAEEYLDVQVGFQPKIQWSQTALVADEQGGSVTLTLTRSQNSSGAVSVNYATAPGTATSPADFTAQSGTVSWADGDTSDKTITIPLVADAVAEGTENFTVTLSGATGGVTGGDPVATVSIVDPGIRDTTFAPDMVNSTVFKILPLPDGSMILGGWFTTVYDASFNAYTRNGITRFSATGTVDPTFAAGGGVSAGNPVYDLALQPDGKIIAVGGFSSYDGATRHYIVRLLADGSADPTFTGFGANSTINAVLVQPDGKILLGGAFTTYNLAAHEYLVRLNADGSIDPGFNGPDFGGTSGWSVQSLALQPDGKILAGGTFYFAGATFKAGICRMLTTGALDASFNGVTDGAHAAGNTGSLRTVRKMVVQPDGQILIAGNFTAFNNTARGGIARLTSTGSLDGLFVPVAIGDCRTILLQPDGKILVGAGNGGTAPTRYLTRLTGTGVVDAMFSSAGDFATDVDDLALLPNGRILSGGNYGNFQGSANGSPIWQFVSGLSGLPGTLQLASAIYSGTENNSVVLSVTRTGGSLGTVTAGFATVDGTATGGTDFTSASGVLTWADGDSTTKTISIPLTLDALTEGTESFTVNLGQPLLGGALLGSIQQATVQINDIPPGFLSWQLGKFTAGELLDANISGPNAVYGQDRLPNLVKYALGLEPKQNITTGLPAVSTTATDWVYTYRCHLRGRSLHRSR